MEVPKNQHKTLPRDPVDKAHEPLISRLRAELEAHDFSLRAAPWELEPKLWPCGYARHRHHDFLNRAGRRVCGVCHPPSRPVAWFVSPAEREGLDALLQAFPGSVVEGVNS